jgi:hypothetical protein
MIRVDCFELDLEYVKAILDILIHLLTDLMTKWFPQFLLFL